MADPVLSLHVEFLTAPMIINDGDTPNTLTIGVFNSSMSDGADGQVMLKAGLPLCFRFIADERQANMPPVRPWGLTTRDWFSQAGIEVEVPPSWKYPPSWDKSTEKGDSIPGRPDLMGWTIAPDKDTALNPGEHITIRISGIRSDLAHGPTTAFFYYQSPGFSPCMYTYGPVQKSPMSLSGQNVGIGTANPRFPLSVKAGPAQNGPAIGLGNNKNNSGFLGFGNSPNQLNYQVPDNNSHNFYVGGNDASPWGRKFMSINNLGVHISPDTRLAGQKLSHGELLKFGVEQEEYQIMHKGAGYFGRPTLALHTEQSNALGFYSSNWTPLLEVEGGTGNTYIRGNAEIAQKLKVAGDLTTAANAYLGGNAEIGQKLKVTGDLTTAGNASFSGNIEIDRDLTTAGNALIKGSVQVQQDAQINGSLSVNLISGYGFHFIPPHTFSQTDYKLDYDAALIALSIDHLVPDGASAIILEAVGGTASNDASCYVTHTKVRDSSKGYLLLRANQKDRKGDLGAVLNQGIYPLSADRKIWFWVEEQFELGLLIRLIGYFGPPKP